MAKMQVSMVLPVEALGASIRGTATLSAWNMEHRILSLVGPERGGDLAMATTTRNSAQMHYTRMNSISLRSYWARSVQSVSGFKTLTGTYVYVLCVITCNHL